MNLDYTSKKVLPAYIQNSLSLCILRFIWYKNTGSDSIQALNAQRETRFKDENLERLKAQMVIYEH